MNMERGYVFGSEMEWSMMVKVDENQPLRAINSQESTEILKLFPRDFIATANSNGLGGWGRDGSRVYQDYNDFIETATPEHTELSRLIASERLHSELVRRALVSFQESEGYMSAMLVQRTMDYSSHSQGYHVSHLADPSKIKINEVDLYRLALHEATKNIYAGAGTLYLDRKRQLRYAIAQKALGLNVDFHHNTTQFKPVMNLRNEPHSNPDKFERLHITCNDNPISPWTKAMNVGSSELVIGAMEQGKLRQEDYWLAEPSMNNPIAKLAVAVAKDPSVSTMTKLERFGTISVIDLQEKYLEDVSNSEYPQEFAGVLSEWEDSLEKLRRDPGLLADRSEWVAKQNLIERHMGRHGIELATADEDAIKQLTNIDIKWSTVGSNWAERSLSPEIWEKWSPDAATQKEAYDPPKTTRALIRGNFAQEHGDNAFINWSTLALKGGRTIPLNDPLRTDPLTARELGLASDLLDDEIAS